jgi:excisionase family DNA binding protein
MAKEIIQDISNEEEWLPLSKAAALLGVHSMTLRRWSDSGRFPYYRTPGSHRRFALADIEAYIAQQKGQRLPRPVASAFVSTALAQTRQQVALHPQSRWLEGIHDEALRNEYRQMGRQMLGLLLQYIAADAPDDAFIEEASKIGWRQAEYGLRAGLSLTSLLEATLFFRDVLIESSLQMAPAGANQAETNLRLLRRVNDILNRVQLAVAEAYEQALVANS